MERIEKVEPAVCMNCHTGIRKMRYITYFTWLGDQFITVPNFPARVCDMCGISEYDFQAVRLLNTLLIAPKVRKSSKKYQHVISEYLRIKSSLHFGMDQ